MANDARAGVPTVDGLPSPQDEEFADALLSAIGSPLVVRGAHDELIVWNGPAERLLGWRTPEVLGRGFPQLRMAPLEALANDVQHHAARDAPVERELRLVCKDGHEVAVLAQATTMDSAAGPGVVIVLSDLTPHLRAEAPRPSMLEQASLLLQHSADIVALVDLAGTITFVSPAISDSTQYEAGDLVGRSLLDFVHPDDASDARSALAAAVLDESDMAMVTVRFRTRRGDYLWLAGRVVNLLQEPAVGAVLVALHDITQRVQAESELAHRASHDPLTGVPTRVLFLDRLTQHLEHARRHGMVVAVLFWDVDGFKSINDSAGHAVGDRVLVEMARRAGTVMRAEDTVARLGGDEFVACAEVESDAQVAALADRLLGALELDLTLAGGRHGTVTASIGVAYGVAADVETLLHEADQAMYVAKRAGGASISIRGVDAPAQEQAPKTH